MTEVIYRSSIEDVADAMIQRMIPLLNDIAFAKYEGQLVTTEVACEILKCSCSTLLKRITDKSIVPTERSGKIYQFDLKYLLTLNLK